MAGEPGDRWLKLKNGGVSRRDKAEAGGKSGHRPEARGSLCGSRKANAKWSTELMTWATRLITSGELELVPA